MDHLLLCMKKSAKLIKDIDYVICNICNFHAQNLGIHLKKIHKINSANYGEIVISQKSSKKYANHASKNSWLKKAILEGKDLTEYWDKVSKGISKAILNDPSEILRRAKTMAKINQTDFMKQKASDTAKKTSARPEILEQRTKQLAKWRKENPEEFKKCTVAMLNSWQSKPEKKLFNFISTISDFTFKKNQRIKSETFLSSTKEKQIDMADKEKRIYIEFDGMIHFKDIFGTLSLIKEKDELLNKHISKYNWTLIRVSHDQFVYSTIKINGKKMDVSYFKKECLDMIIKILSNNVPGIYKIGDAYGKC